jgi:hypothetical protein
MAQPAAVCCFTVFVALSSDKPGGKPGNIDGSLEYSRWKKVMDSYSIKVKCTIFKANVKF